MKRTVPTLLHNGVDEVLRESSGALLKGHRESTTSKPRHCTFEQLGSEPQIGAILVATDFSPASARALQRAVEIASQYHATLTILHVIDILMPCRTGSAQTMMRALTAESSERMAQLSRDLTRGPKTHFALKDGLPWEEIVLESKYFDLLVMAREEAPKQWAWFSQKTWQRVIDSAGCPVLTVSSPGDNESLSRAKSGTARYAVRSPSSGGMVEGPRDAQVCDSKLVSAVGQSSEPHRALSHPPR
jgi:nucleotide-binding universal stress UspA family protein